MQSESKWGFKSSSPCSVLSGRRGHKLRTGATHDSAPGAAAAIQQATRAHFMRQRHKHDHLAPRTCSRGVSRRRAANDTSALGAGGNPDARWMFRVVEVPRPTPGACWTHGRRSPLRHSRKRTLETARWAHTPCHVIAGKNVTRLVRSCRQVGPGRGHPRSVLSERTRSSTFAAMASFRVRFVWDCVRPATETGDHPPRASPQPSSLTIRVALATYPRAGGV